MTTSARMKEGQDKIYYITAESYAAAKSSPHLEIFRKKGIEVLLLTNASTTGWSHLTEYEKKPLQSVAKGALDLGSLADQEDKKHLEEAQDTYKDLVERLKKTLEAQVRDVQVSQRLTNSPACLIQDEHDMAVHLQHMLKSAGHELPATKPILEINPDHPLVSRLKAESDEQRFTDWSHVLFDQALLPPVAGWKTRRRSLPGLMTCFSGSPRSLGISGTP